MAKLPPPVNPNEEDWQAFEDWLHSLKSPPPGEIANRAQDAPAHDFPHTTQPEDSPVPEHAFDEGRFDEADQHHVDLAEIIAKLYGEDPWSAINNNRSVIAPPGARGTLGGAPPGMMPRSGPLINTPLVPRSIGSQINVPTMGLPGGPMGGALLPSPGFKPGQGISLKDFLALKAATQAQAHGHTIARQRVA